jgi:PAS domain S-box-containing protein
VGATVLALIMHVIHVRTLTRLERLRRHEAQNVAAVAAAAREAQQSEERFRRLADATFEALIFHDEGRIVDMNRRAMDLFACTLDEARGTSIWDFVAPQSHSPLRDQKPTTDTQPFELVAQRQDGTTFQAEINVRMLPAEGRTLCVMATRDITARKRIEAEREQLIAELDSFAHTVAHDLKGPLSLIVAYAQMLDDEAGQLSSDEQRTFAQEIAEGSTKLDKIIDELLLLAQVRHGDVTRDVVAMEDIVMNVFRRVLPLQYETQATIDLPDTWPQVVGYGPWIEEVWYNYVCNAIKYGGDPPHVTLGATPQPDGTVRFWVRDNGAGLSPDEQAQLFQPFSRLNRVDTQGYGLGLSIVQRIMDRLDGAVGVDSTPGNGCEFYFVLPAAPPGSAPVTRPIKRP